MTNTFRTPSEGFGLEDDRDDLPFQIHHELDDVPLSVWAFRVYAHLVRRAGKDGKIFPSYQSIGEACFRATYGPSANPKSLRNKAMIAMKELITVGLVLKAERTRKGSKESDTNIYQLTPRRKWLESLKERRAALDAQTERAQERLKAEKQQRKAEGGGTPTVPPSIPTVPPGSTPTVPRGIPTVPEVISIEVLQSLEVISRESGGHSFTETAREATQAEHPAPSVAVIEAPAPTTTDHASLEKQNGQAEQEDLTTGEAGTPDGVIEDALGVTDEDVEMLFGSHDENVEELEEVPGAAAAGRAALSSLVGTPPSVAPQELPTPSAVDLLRAIPQAELLGRPAAMPADANYKAIVGMVGGKKVIEDGILDDNTPSGGVPRKYWLHLASEELGQIRTLAQAEAKATGASFLTLCILGLDRLIGAPRRTEKATSPIGGNAYEAKVPGALKAELPSGPSKYVPGSQWRNRKSGDVLTLQEIVPTRNANGGGMAYLMSNGKTMTVLDLIPNFDAV
jgi:hypothetical protein